MQSALPADNGVASRCAVRGGGEPIGRRANDRTHSDWTPSSRLITTSSERDKTIRLILQATERTRIVGCYKGPAFGRALVTVQPSVRCRSCR